MTKQDKYGKALIKKYANRRLYNTQTSCYITLEDLYEMIKLGEDFEVKDAKTDEDLTRSVLTQIIFEQEAKGYNLLPISFLRQVISLYDKTSLGNMVPNYLNISMDNFMQNKEKLREFSTDGWKEFTPIKIFENIAKQNMEVFEKTLSMFAPKKPEDK
jgi:polyhydroxyalkanoate synthesis repressor PhaR